MSWTPCADDHDWQPIQGWYARYRCDKCRVVAYKKLVTRSTRNRHKNVLMHPYKCPKCHGPTTQKSAACPSCKL